MPSTHNPSPFPSRPHSHKSPIPRTLLSRNRPPPSSPTPSGPTQEPAPSHTHKTAPTLIRSTLKLRRAALDAIALPTSTLPQPNTYTPATARSTVHLHRKLLALFHIYISSASYPSSGAAFATLRSLRGELEWFVRQFDGGVGNARLGGLIVLLCDSYENVLVPLLEVLVEELRAAEKGMCGLEWTFEAVGDRVGEVWAGKCARGREREWEVQRRGKWRVRRERVERRVERRAVEEGSLAEVVFTRFRGGGA
ncbi:hypothetical protein K458DRAFT_456439 [Lentithecium fluviatile CBS 122367]|uniref:Uncharacterized protein n=1 Tax=Lentithecium fluviatile CBS 122367 TaxID=1168545 RepID=A0A6G1IUP4_9PLEO|nr:hypothetical protein K458DRAFT_456439 [Lentithecium fluviatile CBS 122367]